MKALAATAVIVGLLAGCGSPNAANIQLRKKNQELEAKVAELEKQLTATRASVAAMESRATTVPILPQAQLDRLFTAHSLRIEKATSQSDLDVRSPGDEGLRVYVAPIDQYDQPIKAAGSFVVDAYDLSNSTPTLLGHWEFGQDQVPQYFQSALMFYSYALPCPWQALPKQGQVTVHVTFRDGLTGREFSAERVVKVAPPAATLPAAARP